MMDSQEVRALQQVVTDQAERLGSVQEQVNRAKCALLDHDLNLVQYWLNQIEKTSGHLASLSASPQAAGRPYAGIWEG
jgi:hypothetical protein